MYDIIHINMGGCIGKHQNTQRGALKAQTNTVTLKDTVEYIPKVGRCTVVKVYDGDTITVATTIPGDSTLYRFSVRFRGIDTPEMKPTDPNSVKGKEEKEIACMARDFLAEKVMGQTVELRDIGNEKYGRLLANVFCRGEDLAECILKQRLAIPYGGTEPKSWKKFHSSGSLD